MARYSVTIDTGNAAFENPAEELARILRDLAEKLETNGCMAVIKLRDINGNTVGSAGWR